MIRPTTVFADYRDGHQNAIKVDAWCGGTPPDIAWKLHLKVIAKEYGRKNPAEVWVELGEVEAFELIAAISGAMAKAWTE